MLESIGAVIIQLSVNTENRVRLASGKQEKWFVGSYVVEAFTSDCASLQWWCTVALGSTYGLHKKDLTSHWRHIETQV